jgi:hypothetical protein
MSSNFVLCRPQNGLNDMLSTIEKCCRYGEQFQRKVIIDTNYSYSNTWHADFDMYFTSLDENLILSPKQLEIDLNSLRVFPYFLTDRVNSYVMDKKILHYANGDWQIGSLYENSVVYTSKYGKMVYRADSCFKKIITYDFSKPYNEQLLVHHHGWRDDTLSLSALKRLRLTPFMQEELKKRFMMIDGPYSAIHVRHTDYLSDYTSILKILEQNPPTKLFIATDNSIVLDVFIRTLKHTQIFSFARELSRTGKPIHVGKDSMNFQKNVDAILDLLMLASAEVLWLTKIVDKISIADFNTPDYSGFSILAYNLKNNKIILQNLISNPLYI